MTQLTYSETFDVIAKYINGSLPMFADGWSRFPAPAVSDQLIKRLEESSVTYSNLGLVESVEEISRAIFTLNARKDAAENVGRLRL